MKLFKILSIVVFPMFIGCTIINGVNVKYDNKRCFKKRELEDFISKKKIETSHLFIKNIVVNQNECIGLFGFVPKNLNVTSSVVYKVLKTKDSIFYSSNDNKLDVEVLNYFFSENDIYFSNEEKIKLQESFLKGTEINSRIF